MAKKDSYQSKLEKEQKRKDSIRAALSRINVRLDEIRNKIDLSEDEVVTVAKSIERDFLDSDLVEIGYSGKAEIAQYIGSKFRIEKYKSLSENDLLFNSFLKQIYGGKENYFDFNESLNERRVYNPNTDFEADVSVITEENFFKSSYISSNELILELIDGICTIDFMRVDGLVGHIVGTLAEEYVPQSYSDVRFAAFGGLPGNRILVWNTLKSKWSSFYMSNLRRFVKDETSGIQ